MKKLLFLIVTLFWQLPEEGKAQITIHPEIGVSYLNFTLQQQYFLKEPRKIDPIFGVSAHLPILTHWYMKSRISYCKRADKVFSSGSSIPSHNEYTQSELNTEFSINYRINNFVDAGIGPSVIRSFAGAKTFFSPTENRYAYTDFDQFFMGINAGISVGFESLRLNLTYSRLIKDDQTDVFTVGSNRFDLTVSYHLLGGDKGKKR